MKKFKIVKSEHFKKQEMEMPDDVKKELDEALEKLAENPYIGKPVDIYKAVFIFLEDIYELEPEEVASVLLSNPEINFKQYLKEVWMNEK